MQPTPPFRIAIVPCVATGRHPSQAVRASIEALDGLFVFETVTGAARPEDTGVAASADAVLTPAHRCLPNQDLEPVAVLARSAESMALFAPNGRTRPGPSDLIGLPDGSPVVVFSEICRLQLQAVRPDLQIFLRPADRPFDDGIAVLTGAEAPPPEGWERHLLPPDLVLPPTATGQWVILSTEESRGWNRLRTLEDPGARRCLQTEQRLHRICPELRHLACRASLDPDGAIRLQAVTIRPSEDPRSAIVRVGAVAPRPETAADLCRQALARCLVSPPEDSSANNRRNRR